MINARRGQPTVRAGGHSRRAVARTALAAGLGTALLAATGGDGLVQGTPQAMPAVEELGPRRYLLTGDDGVAIEFVPASAAEPAMLAYRDARLELSFSGDDLELVEHQALGVVVSVLLEAAPDAFVRYLSLLVPAVNREEDGPEVAIETVAILTDHLTNFAGPAAVKGPLQTYAVIPLDGVAEFDPA